MAVADSLREGLSLDVERIPTTDEFFEPEPSASPREQAHLEEAHHAICTALTVLRVNVELIRMRLREGTAPGTRVVVHSHLTELDAAVDRLQRLAVEMRVWHSGAPGALTERSSESGTTG